jgi:glycerol-3-phosphate dehydrogenase (NAD(P)+)
MAHVAVIGAGSWGTALAIHLARLGRRVRLWGRNAVAIETLARERTHPSHPGIAFPESLEPEGDLVRACGGAVAVVVGCASHAVRDVAHTLEPMLSPGSLVVSTAKGIEAASSKSMAEVLEEVLGVARSSRVSVLSGPSFAREVALGLPTAVTAAARTLPVAEEVQRLFSGPTFRVYSSRDLPGVEIGGAVKNVIALAAGVSDGLGFGSNTRAALITRGLAEIARLGTKRGANRATLSGLSGMGDLVLTCTGELSRNRQVGLRIGRGEALQDILSSMTEVAEGVRNTVSIRSLAASLGVEMPITEQMYQVLYEGRSPRSAVETLMARSLKEELA